MKAAIPAVVATALILGACTAPTGGTGDDTRGRPASVPQAVVEIAAPHQDLSTARLLPDDKCYWYMHAGRVDADPGANAETRSAASPLAADQGT